MLQWAMFSLVFILFLIYFPENQKRVNNLDLPAKLHDLTNEWKTALLVAIICIGHLAISFFITVILLAVVGSPSEHWETNYWAGFLGIISMILASFQYFPQIVKTWKRKVRKRKGKKKVITRFVICCQLQRGILKLIL